MYKCLQKHEWLTSLGYTIAPVKKEDMENIRLYRNAQIPILRQNRVLSDEDQKRYFQEHVVPSFEKDQPTEILLSYSKDGALLGYGGLVHIDWEYKRAEVSFLLDPQVSESSENFEKYFLDYVEVLKTIAFDEITLHKLTACVFSLRPKMPELLVKAGFTFEGKYKDHVFKNERWYDALQFGFINSSKGSKSKQGAVLVTSISKKIPLLNAVKQASSLACAFQTLYGADSNPDCIAKYSVDHFWKCKPIAELAIEEVIHFCKDHDIGAIIPTRDLELVYWAKHKEALKKEGINVLVSSKETIALLRDKKSFSDVFVAAGISAIPTYDSIEQTEGKEFVVKERFGSGAKGLGLRLSKSQAIRWADKLQDPVFQPYIEGKEFSVDVFITNKRKLHGIVVRSRDVVVDGEAQVTTTLFHQKIIDYITKIVSLDKIELVGHAIFQVIESSCGTLYVIECNPRFGGASTASVAVGLDSFFWFFQECLGSDLTSYPFTRSSYNIRQVRHPQDKVFIWS